MRTNRVAKILMALACLVVAAAGAVTFFLIYNGREYVGDTTITINEETTKTLKAEIAGLYPGGKSEYTITLDGDNIEEFYVDLSMRRNESSVLEKYITVTICYGNTTFEKTLSEMFALAEPVSLGKAVPEIKIVYTMSEDAGNDTQGAEMTFYIDLSAHRL